MKKIALVLPNNMYLAPYVNKYISILTECKLDLIYWDRFEIFEEVTGVHKVYRYVEKMSHNNSVVSQREKLVKYSHFTKYVKRICKIEKYDNVIIFQPMMAFMYWMRNFFGDFSNIIIDIRDFTYEYSAFFKLVEKIMFKKCKFIVISSPWYKEFLPDNAEYITMENMNYVDKTDILKARNEKKSTKKKIRIGYIGLVRFIEQNYKIIDKFANDDRFELLYIGKGSEALKPYLKEHSIHNVKLIPQFDPKETINHFMSVDLIQNIYGTGRDKLRYALSNKLYYAAMLGKPILVSPNTCMQKVSEKYEFGFSCDENDLELADKIYEYYNKIDWRKCYSGCDSFIDNVLKNEEIMKITFENLQK